MNFRFIVLIFLPYPCPTITLHNFCTGCQVLPIDFSIELPTKWYIATLVPWGATKLIF